jgi:hypothetical protein
MPIRGYHMSTEALYYMSWSRWRSCIALGCQCGPAKQCDRLHLLPYHTQTQCPWTDHMHPRLSNLWLVGSEHLLSPFTMRLDWTNLLVVQGVRMVNGKQEQRPSQSLWASFTFTMTRAGGIRTRYNALDKRPFCRS